MRMRSILLVAFLSTGCGALQGGTISFGPPDIAPPEHAVGLTVRDTAGPVAGAFCGLRGATDMAVGPSTATGTIVFPRVPLALRETELLCTAAGYLAFDEARTLTGAEPEPTLVAWLTPIAPPPPPIPPPPPVPPVPPQPPPASAPSDGLDFAHAAIVNAPDVRAWPATATITEISFLEGTTRVVFSKEYGPDRWPDIRPAGWDGPLQYTLWLCLQTPAWTCSGFIQFWNGRDGTGDSSDPDVPSRWDQHWYYAARWASLFGHGPIRPGESIGLLVTSGNARDNVGPLSVQERSNVVVIPATDRGTFTFGK